MEVGWILGGLFVFVTFFFIAGVLLLPEFFGITGNRAKKIMEEEQQDLTVSPGDKTKS